MSNISVGEILKIKGKWMAGQEFIKFVAEKKGRTERQAINLINKAWKEDKTILRITLPNRQVLYGLPEFGPIENNQSDEAEQENVREAMEELRGELRFFREPTVDEVALKAGRDPETVKPILYALAPTTGWKPRSQEQAEKEAKDAINLAGWLCWKEKSEQNSKLEAFSKEAINNASEDTLKRAKDILTNYLDLVPKVNSTGLEWSEEAKIKWCHIFGSGPPALQYWGIGATIR